MNIPTELSEALELAADALEPTGYPFLIFVGCENSTCVVSQNLEHNTEMLRDWIQNGHWGMVLSEHLDSLSPPAEECP